MIMIIKCLFNKFENICLLSANFNNTKSIEDRKEGSIKIIINLL